MDVQYKHRDLTKCSLYVHIESANDERKWALGLIDDELERLHLVVEVHARNAEIVRQRQTRTGNTQRALFNWSSMLNNKIGDSDSIKNDYPNFRPAQNRLGRTVQCTVLTSTHLPVVVLVCCEPVIHEYVTIVCERSHERLSRSWRRVELRATYDI